MLKVSQLDLRWAADRLGASPLTIGRYGCTTSCISMISDDFGCFKSVVALAHNAANYTKDGLILWNALNLTFAGEMRFVWRGYGAKGKGTPVTDFSSIMNALANPKQRVALEVNNGAHWVKLVKKNTIGKDWTAIDPLGGVECQVLAKYGNITGWAVFEDIKDSVVTPPASGTVDNTLAKSLAGKILLSVDERGRLYYMTPEAKLIMLGTTPEEVLATLAKVALGISKENLAKLPWAK